MKKEIYLCLEILIFYSCGKGESVNAIYAMQ